jgi:tetratricopeptide (TPR) repeat protein
MSVRLVLALALLVPPARLLGADLLAEQAGSDAALEDRVRRLVVHRLTDDTKALTADIATLETEDRRRQNIGLGVTGLTDDARYLAAGAWWTRDARRRALRDLLDADPDPTIERLAEHRLETDDAEAADRLLADDRHNRRASLLNDALRPLGAFSGPALLAAVNPFMLAGSALDSVVTTAVNLWHYNRLSTPEREALARYRALLAAEPETQDAPEIARAIRRLGAKRAEAVCKGTVARGTEELAAGDLDRAAFYLRAAGHLEGCRERAAEPRAEVDEARAQRAAREDAGHWPADEPRRPRPGLEAYDHEAMCIAAASGDPSAMLATATRFRAQHRDSPVDDSARYLIAVARHLAGHPAEGREALDDLADDGDSSVARHARAVLDSPEYSRLDALHAAERQHTRDTVRYVLLGKGVQGRSALYGAAHVGAEGLGGLQTLGLFNAVGILTRAWQAWRHDPASNQAIIDHGESFLARTPDAPEASTVHEELAQAYERAGAYGRALMHYRATADPEPERVTELEGELADQLLGEAERRGGNRALLAAVVERFPDSEAAEKARTRLDELGDAGETVLSRDVLAANPALLGPGGLDLEPTLLDGERANGELADAGVTLTAGSLRLAVRNRDAKGDHTETRRLDPAAYARARAAADEVLYARRVTADETPDDVAPLERYIPFYVQGAVGSRGVSVAPGLKMRRYRSEDRSLYE